MTISIINKTYFIEVNMQSSLNLDVFFKNKTGGIERKKLRDILTTLSADEIQRSHISETAPLTVNQRGPNCTVYALQGAADWLASNTTNYPRARKDKHYKISWRQLAKEENIMTVGGTELKDLYALVTKHIEKTKLERYQLDEKCETEENIKEYSKLLCHTLDHYSVILPFIVPDMPPFLSEENKKKQAFPSVSTLSADNGHVALAWAYIYYKNAYYVLMTHVGAHYLCSMNDIYISNTFLMDTYSKTEIMYKINDSWESKQEYINAYRISLMMRRNPPPIKAREACPFHYEGMESTNKFSMLAIPSPEFKTAFSNDILVDCLMHACIIKDNENIKKIINMPGIVIEKKALLEYIWEKCENPNNIIEVFKKLDFIFELSDESSYSKILREMRLKKSVSLELLKTMEPKVLDEKLHNLFRYYIEMKLDQSKVFETLVLSNLDVVWQLALNEENKALCNHLLSFYTDDKGYVNVYQDVLIRHINNPLTVNADLIQNAMNSNCKLALLALKYFAPSADKKKIDTLLSSESKTEKKCISQTFPWKKLYNSVVLTSKPRERWSDFFLSKKETEKYAIFQSFIKEAPNPIVVAKRIDDYIKLMPQYLTGYKFH